MAFSTVSSRNPQGTILARGGLALAQPRTKGGLKDGVQGMSRGSHCLEVLRLEELKVCVCV